MGKGGFDYFFKVIGTIFIILAIGAIIESFISKNYFQIFWMCYLGLIITGIGIYRKNTYLIVSQINILLIPLLIWNFDFFYRILLNRPLFGITEYIFQPHKYFISVIINSQHLFIIPASLLAIYLIGVKVKGIWKFSLLEVSLFFLVVRLFTPYEKNINYIFKPFSLLDGYFSPLIHPFIWFFITFTMILLANFFLVKLGSLRRNKTGSKIQKI